MVVGDGGALGARVSLVRVVVSWADASRVAGEYGGAEPIPVRGIVSAFAGCSSTGVGLCLVCGASALPDYLGAPMDGAGAKRSRHRCIPPGSCNRGVCAIVCLV